VESAIQLALLQIAFPIRSVPSRFSVINPEFFPAIPLCGPFLIDYCDLNNDVSRK
jgi:hypothetical protein